MKDIDRMEAARRAYKEVPIPDALDSRVREGICRGKEARARRRGRRLGAGLSVAACFALLLAGLNLSPDIAQAAANVPVLGGVFRVLTVARFDGTDGEVNYLLSVPRVQAPGDTGAAVSAAIQDKVDRHMERARQDWAEYKEAFFATGGTQEEWADKEMDVRVDYEIKSQSDTRVSFVVTMTEGWVTAREERSYYDLDLAEDRAVTLRDLLGEDWVAIANAAIRSQIEESRAADGSTDFFPPEAGGFTTVDEDTDFYIRDDGVPVAVFPRYSIAVGTAGWPEFPLQ